ncbi:MAG: hypothetical protein ACK5MP_12425 [Nostocoides sp.]
MPPYAAVPSRVGLERWAAGMPPPGRMRSRGRADQLDRGYHDAGWTGVVEHSQRSSGLTLAMTWSTCMPHPRQVVLWQVGQIAGLHMAVLLDH